MAKAPDFLYTSVQKISICQNMFVDNILRRAISLVLKCDCPKMSTLVLLGKDSFWRLIIIRLIVNSSESEAMIDEENSGHCLEWQTREAFRMSLTDERTLNGLHSTILNHFSFP